MTSRYNPIELSESSDDEVEITGYRTAASSREPQPPARPRLRRPIVDPLPQSSRSVPISSSPSSKVRRKDTVGIATIAPSIETSRVSQRPSPASDQHQPARPPSKVLPRRIVETEASQRLVRQHGGPCQECSREDLQCDGELDCSRCDALSLECVYPSGARKPPVVGPSPVKCGSKPNAQLGLSLVKRSRTRNDLNKINEAPRTRSLPRNSISKDTNARDLRQQSLEPSPEISQADSPKDLVVNLKKLELVPHNKRVPQSLEDVKKLIRVHEENLKAHREYVVQAQLLKAQKQCFTSSQRNNTEQNLPKENPFKKYLQDRDAPKNDDLIVGITTLHARQTRGPKRFVPEKIPYKRLEVDPKIPLLPKYKSIGRLGTSFLSKNYHTLRYIHYFPDDDGSFEATDKEQELKERYRHADSEEICSQRKCLELVYLWTEEVELLMKKLELAQDHIRAWLGQSTLSKCQTCRLPYKNITRPGEVILGTQTAQRCQWLSEAVADTIHVGLWHFISSKPGEIEKNKSENTTPNQSTLCSICLIYNCLNHGSYLDQEDNERKVLINDPERENNRRVRAVAKAPEQPAHVCGLFCVDGMPAGTPLVSDLETCLGLSQAGRLEGKYRLEFPYKTDSGPISGLTCCSDTCFLPKANRTRYYANHNGNTDDLGLLMVSLKESNCSLKQISLSMVGQYRSYLRLPCFLAKSLKIDCLQAFAALVHLYHTQPIPHPAPDSQPFPSPSSRKVSKDAAGYRTDRARELDSRPPFTPCSHEGPCLGQSGCSCATGQIHCEYFCACPPTCRRRFKGCACKGSCFTDERCECWVLNRECDPWLCKKCGVVEVLDPSNKYNEEIRRGRCQNNKILLDLPARTIKAPSEVQGWGLFAGQDLDAGAFIGEYKGEIISGGVGEESDRRGVVYHNIGQEYLFIVNFEQQMDGSSFGNKTRFMNNSQLEQNINVLAKKLLTNGMQRIMFYTNRKVKAGEELLYNYNYPEEVYKQFWEKGDKTFGNEGMITPFTKPKLKVDGKLWKSAGAGVGKRDGEESVARKRDQMSGSEAGFGAAPARWRGGSKRKRAVENEDEDETDDNDEDETEDEDEDEDVDEYENENEDENEDEKKDEKEDEGEHWMQFLLREVGFQPTGNNNKDEDDFAAEGLVNTLPDPLPEASDAPDAPDAVGPSDRDKDSDQSEEVYEDSEDDDVPLRRLQKPRQRQRIIREGDRRRGGEAQRRAWAARKAKMAAQQRRGV